MVNGFRRTVAVARTALPYPPRRRSARLASPARRAPDRNRGRSLPAAARRGTCARSRSRRARPRRDPGHRRSDQCAGGGAPKNPRQGRWIAGSNAQACSIAVRSCPRRLARRPVQICQVAGQRRAQLGQARLGSRERPIDVDHRVPRAVDVAAQRCECVTRGFKVLRHLARVVRSARWLPRGRPRPRRCPVGGHWWALVWSRRCGCSRGRNSRRSKLHARPPGSPVPIGRWPGMMRIWPRLGSRLWPGPRCRGRELGRGAFFLFSLGRPVNTSPDSASIQISSPSANVCWPILVLLSRKSRSTSSSGQPR